MTGIFVCYCRKLHAELGGCFFFFLNFLTATSEICFLWVFRAGELTLLILSARAGKLLEHFWVCFLGCVPVPLLLQSHSGKEMEGEQTPEAELCSVTAPLPTSLLLPREANAPSASLREERCCRQPQPGSPSSEMLLGGGTQERHHQL